jgi:hypothetical protein
MPLPKYPDESPPDELFHYTSAYSLNEIIGNRTVWASSVGWVNDSTELAIAGEVVRTLLRDRADAIGTGRVSEGLRQLADYLRVDDLLRSDPDFGAQVTVCAFSLSEKGDDLNQWRAYCPVNGGYALGFRTSSLLSIVPEAGRWRLARCFYTPSEHLRVLGALVDWVVDHDLVGDIEWRANFWREFLWLAPLIKHSAFADEKEWRLVSGKVAITSLKLRATGSHIIPYKPIPLSGSFVGKVVVGPQLDQSLGRRGAEALLAKARDTVVLSEIPYRLV